MAQRRAAFFDVDHTVLAINSGSAWVRYLRRKGRITVGQTLQSMWWLAQYKLSLLDFDAMTARILSSYEGQDVASIREEVAAWFHEEIAPMVCREAKEAIEYHRRQGDVLVLLTSATRYLAHPLAEYLGIEAVLCTEVEECDGVLTGRHVQPVCYGPGKVHYAEKFAKAHDIGLSRSYFYTDSYSDLPMLLRVGNPRVVNPDPRLKRTARSLGWGYVRWSTGVP